jgi:antitoxin component of MazEF toxin-antitoxin module
MKLHKLINRVHRGKTYYRWVVTLPPRRIREIGWFAGQTLQAEVRGDALVLRAAPPAPRPRGRSRAAQISEAARLRRL